MFVMLIIPSRAMKNAEDLKRSPEEDSTDVKRVKSVDTVEQSETPDVTDSATPNVQLETKTDNPPVSTPSENPDAPPSDEYKWPNKKRYAIMMGFCGEAYKGMALNPGVRTIEEELIRALGKTKLIRPDNAKDIKKLGFQRASRTDKGVSAARQIVSCNLHMPADPIAVLAELNAALPKDIIVYDIIKTTKSFDSHKFASSRVYEYLCPSFAMAPTLGDTWSGYKIPSTVLENVRTFMQNYVGTKNYFNYTSNKQHSDPSCFRYLRSINVSEPFIMNEIEWIRISIHGDSFIYHQIRKIVGMTIAVMRNVTPKDHLEKSFAKDRCDVPLAPGVGLVLDEVKVDRYNKKFGGDGNHIPLIWEPYEEQVLEFKKNNIYNIIYGKEKASGCMFVWIQTLKKHTFYTGDVLPDLLCEKTELAAVEAAQPGGNGDKKDEVVISVAELENVIPTEN